MTASANVKNPQTFNRYSYVLNSPYKFVDPLGLVSSNTAACGTWCSNRGGAGEDSVGGIFTDRDMLSGNFLKQQQDKPELLDETPGELCDCIVGMEIEPLPAGPPRVTQSALSDERVPNPVFIFDPGLIEDTISQDPNTFEAVPVRKWGSKFSVKLEDQYGNPFSGYNYTGTGGIQGVVDENGIIQLPDIVLLDISQASPSRLEDLDNPQLDKKSTKTKTINLTLTGYKGDRERKIYFKLNVARKGSKGQYFIQPSATDIRVFVNTQSRIFRFLPDQK